MKRRWIVLWVLGVVLLVGAFPAGAGRVVRSELISFDSLKDATGGDDLVHTFSEKPGKVRVSVECRLKRGSFTWRVESPDGKILWEETAQARSTVELDSEFAGVAGDWTIVIDYKKARGRYKIRMEAVP